MEGPKVENLNAANDNFKKKNEDIAQLAAEFEAQDRLIEAQGKLGEYITKLYKEERYPKSILELVYQKVINHKLDISITNDPTNLRLYGIMGNMLDEILNSMYLSNSENPIIDIHLNAMREVLKDTKGKEVGEIVSFPSNNPDLNK
jgi:hypothetical protein